jgi:trans-aconitate 2-methyltransferase
MSATENDWDPGSYASFRGLRLRPAIDLLMQVGAAPAGEIIDLGCGDGAMAAPLRRRFPQRRIVGVDASPAMLAEARGYDATLLTDIGAWLPEEPPAVIYSNAALQWLPDHAALFPRLVALLPPGGWLAVQMPRQEAAPSHRLLRDTALELFPDRVGEEGPPRVAEPETYARMLSPLGELSLWETRYLQRLGPVGEGHPVRHFTASTAMRPWVDGLTGADRARFVASYDRALAAAYPPEADGAVLFPFQRLFMVLAKA